MKRAFGRENPGGGLDLEISEVVGNLREWAEYI